MHSRVAAIDVGSNSMRIAVIETDGGAFLEVVQEARAVPRLIRDVRTAGRLSAASMERVLDVLREFLAIARSSSATDVAAVATSAVRDAANADELVATVRSQLGIELQVASGEEEARFAFLGALHSLPVTDGVLVDIGGGSAELVRFRGRAAESLLSLQLGAVRLTDDFLGNDPPTPEQLRALRKHLAREFSRARLGRLKPGSQFVGTGGTVRNLAKIARVRYGHPLPHLHGYSLSRARLGELVSDLSGMPRAARLEIAGLNEDRAETIVAGALVIEALLESLDADELVVSGQGLREGWRWLTRAGRCYRWKRCARRRCGWRWSGSRRTTGRPRRDGSASRAGWRRRCPRAAGMWRRCCRWRRRCSTSAGALTTTTGTGIRRASCWRGASMGSGIGSRRWWARWCGWRTRNGMTR